MSKACWIFWEFEYSFLVNPIRCCCLGSSLSEGTASLGGRYQTKPRVIWIGNPSSVHFIIACTRAPPTELDFTEGHHPQLSVRGRPPFQIFPTSSFVIMYSGCFIRQSIYMYNVHIFFNNYVFCIFLWLQPTLWYAGNVILPSSIHLLVPLI